MKKAINKYYCELALTLTIVFQQSHKFFFSGPIISTIIGNFDPLYLLSIFTFKTHKFKVHRYLKEILFMILILIYSFLQYCFNPNLLLIKWSITFAKLFICILIMKLIISKASNFDFFIFINFFSVINSILLGLALIFKESEYFWTVNDIVNKYDLLRLRFFYVEPSELGFRIGILIILALSLLIKSSFKKQKLQMLFSLLINSVILYLSKSLLTTLLVLIAIVVMLIFEYRKIIIYNKRKILVLAGVISLFLITYISVSDNTLITRIIEVFKGNDSSSRYRVSLAFRVMNDSLPRFNLLGVGLGNVNTDYFLAPYLEWGLVTVITNSFVYFVVELGILGILIFIAFFMYMTRKSFANISSLGLLIYIVGFQFAGGYFTNPINFIIYGLIIAGGVKLKGEKNV